MSELIKSIDSGIPPTLELIKQTRDPGELVRLGRSMFPSLFQAQQDNGKLDLAPPQISGMETQFIKERQYDIPGCDSAAWMVSSGIGGDIYKFFAPKSQNGQPESHSAGLLIGDAVGHDILAGYLARYTHAAFKAHWSANKNPARLMQEVNQTLIAGIENPGLFVTALYGNLNPNSGEFYFARAGHVFPLVYGANGEPIDIPHEESQALNSGNNPTLHIGMITVPRDGMLLLVTDGILESPQRVQTIGVGMRPGQQPIWGESLGIEGFNRIVKSVWNYPEPMHDKLKAITTSVLAYQGIPPGTNDLPYDDTTIMGIHRL